MIVFEIVGLWFVASLLLAGAWSRMRSGGPRIHGGPR